MQSCLAEVHDCCSQEASTVASPDTEAVPEAEESDELEKAPSLPNREMKLGVLDLGIGSGSTSR
jgi:hypothetical protein